MLCHKPAGLPLHIDRNTKVIILGFISWRDLSRAKAILCKSAKPILAAPILYLGSRPSAPAIQ